MFQNHQPAKSLTGEKSPGMASLAFSLRWMAAVLKRLPELALRKASGFVHSIKWGDLVPKIDKGTKLCLSLLIITIHHKMAERFTPLYFWSKIIKHATGIRCPNKTIQGSLTKQEPLLPIPRPSRSGLCLVEVLRSFH